MTTSPPLFEPALSDINGVITIEIHIPHTLFNEIDTLTTEIFNNNYDKHIKHMHSFLAWIIPVPRAPIQQHLPQNEITRFDVKLIDENDPARWFIMSGKNYTYGRLTRCVMLRMMPSITANYTRKGKYGAPRCVENITFDVKKNNNTHIGEDSRIRKAALYYPHIHNKSTKALKAEFVFIKIQTHLLSE